MNGDSRLFEIFLDVQRGLPRQGPGCAESTLRALALCRERPEGADLLDVGCGPGMQTVALTEEIDGKVIAVDIHREYLTELEARAGRAGVASRIETLTGDMKALPFAAETFDLIWCEGAAYIMGFEEALVEWRKLLRPGGYIAATELVWLKPDPPTVLAEFWAREYPALTGVQANLTTIGACGYDPAAHFTLPDTAWWEHYYTPLEAKLPSLRERYAGDHAASEVIEATAREIEMRRLFPDWYGYEFFVARRAA